MSNIIRRVPRNVVVSSLLAILAMLAVLASSWVKQPAPRVLADAHTTRKHHLVCAASSNLSLCLVQVKPTFSGCGGSATPAPSYHTHLLAAAKSTAPFALTESVASTVQLPLWLLNRSLLI